MNVAFYWLIAVYFLISNLIKISGENKMFSFSLPSFFFLSLPHFFPISLSFFLFPFFFLVAKYTRRDSISFPPVWTLVDQKGRKFKAIKSLTDCCFQRYQRTEVIPKNYLLLVWWCYQTCLWLNVTLWPVPILTGFVAVTQADYPCIPYVLPPLMVGTVFSSLSY